jgi:hypothetical protein
MVEQVCARVCVSGLCADRKATAQETPLTCGGFGWLVVVVVPPTEVEAPEGGKLVFAEVLIYDDDLSKIPSHCAEYEGLPIFQSSTVMRLVQRDGYSGMWQCGTRSGIMSRARRLEIGCMEACECVCTRLLIRELHSCVCVF